MGLKNASNKNYTKQWEANIKEVNNFYLATWLHMTKRIQLVAVEGTIWYQGLVVQEEEAIPNSIKGPSRLSGAKE